MSENEERRACVQRAGGAHRKPEPSVAGGVSGTISWAEHEEAWEAYARRYGRGQSAERIQERGGFAYCELLDLLGRAPTTWTKR